MASFLSRKPRKRNNNNTIKRKLNSNSNNSNNNSANLSEYMKRLEYFLSQNLLIRDNLLFDEEKVDFVYLIKTE